MHSIVIVIDAILQLYSWVLIVWVVLSWLIAFNVVNTRNRFVYTLSDVLYRLTEPTLRPLRRVLPDLGGVDLSPVALWFIIYLLRLLLREYFW